MIRVIAQKPHKGLYPYAAMADGRVVEGRSRQPLLDGCRQLQAIAVSPAVEIALFHEGATEWALRTTVGYGASQTVDETRNPRFAKFKAWKP